MIYSRWNPSTGLYDYFESAEQIGLNDDLPVPALPPPASAIGVPSVECGRPLPADAVHIGTGELAQGSITQPGTVPLLVSSEATTAEARAQSAVLGFLAGAAATLGLVWLWRRTVRR